MFTDIVKSTNLAEAMGDDAWLELLRWHDETLRAAFASHNGEEVGTTGDGFFVVFDSPDAAVTCAVAIQRRLADHRKQHGFAPQVRIGLHASEAAQVENDFRGKGGSRGVAHRGPGRGRRDRREQANGRSRAAVPGDGAADRHAQGHLRARGGRLDRLALSPAKARTRHFSWDQISSRRRRASSASRRRTSVSGTPARRSP